MTTAIDSVSLQDEYPPAVDLKQMLADQPVPVLAPETVDLVSLPGDAATREALAVLDAFNAALDADDVMALEKCFLTEQAYWKDALALTYHLRTFYGSGVIAANFLETKKLRGVVPEWKLEGATFVSATPVLQFIDVSLSFRTTLPETSCSARFMLLPVKKDSGALEWKIWILSTKLENLDLHSEDESLLQAPGRKLDGLDTIETDVFIIGGGNAAVTLAGRLKALGVDSVMAERNPRVGDNWALRYDCMRFHLPTAFCELPYITFDKDLQAPHLLTKDELAEQVRRFASGFNLNIITSAEILSTVYDQTSRRWSVKFQTPSGVCTAVSKHLVQATGIGSQKPYLPAISDEKLYKGISIHSEDFKSGKDLAQKGSAIVIGSANTAFDGQLGRGLFAMFASKEPDRYAALEAAGFPVQDSAHPSQALYSNLVERAGGHYVDVGGTRLIAEGKVGIKAGVQPVAFTETGLRFSDDSIVDIDAIVWCTGFADRDARAVAAEILGGGEATGDKNLLGPADIAARLDATWGVDSEGEIRGMWKRHLRLENYWVMGGYTQLHRWHSKTLALQIKAALEGILPPAYRDTL
ncbi:hypothetical protein ACJZ2D_009292 [Fusarium nematophilum]